MRFTRPSSTARTVLPGAIPVRLPRRNTWVSTAMVSWPKATFSTTLAVLRPTPGSASRASRSLGTWPPCRSSSSRDSSTTFFDLACHSPMLRMCAATPSTPKATMAAGSGAAANRVRPALLTATSVVCADITTAQSRV